MTKHYDEAQWRQYIDNTLDEERRDEMEAHLFGCDHCLQTFTGLLEGQKVCGVDFADEVMDSLPAVRPVPKPVLKTVTPQFRRRMIWCYTAAAVATLVITFTGAFTNFGEGLAQALPASANALTQFTGQITTGLTSMAAPKPTQMEVENLNQDAYEGKEEDSPKLYDILADWLKGSNAKASSQSEKETTK